MPASTCSLTAVTQLFVVLAFSENGQQKWVTQDGATIVTQHGRLVKTLLGGDNLIDVNNLATDPLAKPGQIIDGATWTRTLGWTEHRQVRYATARSVFTWRGLIALASAVKRPPCGC